MATFSALQDGVVKFEIRRFVSPQPSSTLFSKYGPGLFITFFVTQTPYYLWHITFLKICFYRTDILDYCLKIPNAGLFLKQFILSIFCYYLILG